jgi:acyl dehydratase
MPIDVEKVVGTSPGSVTTSWDEDLVILYHLAIGAGDPPTSPDELKYCYEADLRVLPSFASIPAFEAMLSISSLEGMDVNLAMMLHGEHEVELHRPLPVKSTVSSESRITGVYDKGKAALVLVETVSEDEQGPLFTNRASLFIRGEGGFGGESGPSPGPAAPARPPDAIVESKTAPQQALLYRLTGDHNPLHADPSFAALGGFDRPILHGLCSFGIICKAVVGNSLEHDVARVARYGGRFSGVVFPGETIITSIWNGPGILHVEAMVKDRDSAVLTNGTLHLVSNPSQRGIAFCQ